MVVDPIDGTSCIVDARALAPRISSDASLRGLATIAAIVARRGQVVDPSGHALDGAAADHDGGDAASRRLLSTIEAARLLGVSERTLRRRAAAGELEAVRIGRSVRFERRALEKFIEERKRFAH